MIAMHFTSGLKIPGSVWGVCAQFTRPDVTPDANDILRSLSRMKRNQNLTIGEGPANGTSVAAGAVVCLDLLMQSITFTQDRQLS